MKPNHPDYDISTKVLNSMDGKGLMALHDKLHRTPYHKIKNTKNTRSEIQNKILNKAFNYSEIYDNFHEAKDPREYGFEGEMAMSQLKGIMQHAEQLHGMLEPDTDLPEWVQSKITLAYDYMQTAADYMSTEMSEAADNVNETREFYAAAKKRAAANTPQEKISPAWKAKAKVRARAAGRKYPNLVDNVWAARMQEEAPANAAGGGNVAGMGVGPDGEPGVTPKAIKKYKDNNASEAPKAGRKSFSLFMQGK